MLLENRKGQTFAKSDLWLSQRKYMHLRDRRCYANQPAMTLTKSVQTQMTTTTMMMIANTHQNLNINSTCNLRSFVKNLIMMDKAMKPKITNKIMVKSDIYSTSYNIKCQGTKYIIT